MRKLKVLCLTDHSNHSDQNSIYAILREMAAHHRCEYLDVATREETSNDSFFKNLDFKNIQAARVTKDFKFEGINTFFANEVKSVDPHDYDIIFLRLPRPTTDEFLHALAEEFQSTCFVNNPQGIVQCSNKAVLVNFQDVCPPIKLCNNIEEILEFSKKQDLVLKPLKEYGGKGLLKITGAVLNDGIENHDTVEYLNSIKDTIETEGYLAMKYLKNVSQGDKRLIVVGGEILAASLRLPPKDSWICNVALGGTSVKTEATRREIAIVESINPYLSQRGVLIYGVDTLVDDDGERILSEINALSIGGFPQAQVQTGKPIINMTIEKIFTHADLLKHG